MNESQQRAFAALGIGPRWRRRAATGARAVLDQEVPRPAAAEPRAAGAPVRAIECAGWLELRERVAACVACSLAGSRTQTVFGMGDEQASWLFVGEAPGEEEDRLGEPFVGNAGQLLDRMLAALGLSRERDVFIANVLKCRPPQNRDPLPAEKQACAGFLARQIALLAPRVIVATGRVAAQALLGSEASLASLRGRVHEYRSGDRAIALVVTYHPAYLLRTPADKVLAWADLCLARSAHAAANG